MKIEITLDDVQRISSGVIGRAAIAEQVEREIAEIVNRHKEAAKKELDEYLSKVAVACVHEPNSMATKLVIITPD